MINKPTVRVHSKPEPKVEIEHDGKTIDITRQVADITTHTDGQNDYATITLKADADIDFPMEVRVVPAKSTALDNLTADELNGVIAMAGMSTSAGQAILEHLRQRGLDV